MSQTDDRITYFAPLFQTRHISFQPFGELKSRAINWEREKSLLMRAELT
jgi:hypothetical protein